MKTCQCGIILPETNRSGMCRKCYKAWRRKHIKENKKFLCPKCGEMDGEAHGGLCLKCYNHKYQKENKDKIIEKAKKWYQENKERKKIYDRQYRPKKPKDQWKKKETFHGPCKVCGIVDNNIRYVKRMCIRCYKKDDYKKKNVKELQYCKTCGKQLGPKTKGNNCPACRRRLKYNSDEKYKKACLKRNRKYNKSEKGVARKRLAVVRRRAIIANSVYTLTKEEWEEIQKSYNYCCAYCGKKKKLEMDHVVPISKGGATTKDNIVPACRSCNSSKNNKITGWQPRLYV